VLAALEAEELNALCQQDNQPAGESDPLPPTGSSSDHFGFGIAPIATTGQSVGSTDVQRAAEALASAEARQIIRQKKRARR
jgi:hypothetical protein